MDCVYCDKPLICQACGEDFHPSGPAEYEALSRPEVPIVCRDCGSILVCHWCKTPYDGEAGPGD